MSAKRILSIGQCFADHSTISRLLHAQFQAEVVGVDSAAEALAGADRRTFDLVLVNRVLDADGSSGFDVIRQLKTNAAFAEVPVMLVSNYDDAQQEAVALGALPGFGKAALAQPRTMQRLKTILENQEVP